MVLEFVKFVHMVAGRSHVGLTICNCFLIKHNKNPDNDGCIWFCPLLESLNISQAKYLTLKVYIQQLCLWQDLVVWMGVLVALVFVDRDAYNWYSFATCLLLILFYLWVLSSWLILLKLLEIPSDVLYGLMMDLCNCVFCLDYIPRMLFSLCITTNRFHCKCFLVLNCDSISCYLGMLI